MIEETDLPASMGKVARRELALQGLTRLEQFDGMSESALLAIHGVGLKSIRILREHLEPLGSTLRP
ncbi:hypothetical protein ASF87_15315 [Microbacterium sp. Leaf161]|uniref:hypothetical protein n=1 Tax=Microbacterium sp. Leaf161 TaxID=1736281 RepID=UPI0006F8A072|nr:hypothetical protein [Microbacterium sp. Leaf161]KQR43187.1 hypothetical protein ASF87_15315 [Microbacterium sp. Leaf161]